MTRSATKLVCEGKCVADICAVMGARYGTELRPLNAQINLATGQTRVALQVEYGKGRSRKTTNIHGEFCPFCGGKTP